jgi:CheY-like chemotaxis protein
MLSERLCILIADRDIDAADALGALCERLGHEVDFAYDSAAAREAARWLKPDAVLAASALAQELAQDLGMFGLELVDQAAQRLQMGGLREVLVEAGGAQALALFLPRRAR